MPSASSVQECLLSDTVSKWRLESRLDEWSLQVQQQLLSSIVESLAFRIEGRVVALLRASIFSLMGLASDSSNRTNVKDSRRTKCRIAHCNSSMETAMVVSM
mmetsp:Transcript_21403/g.59347  ORF Transcript_21403/g.59347 Transcript_21403/m.59347 type:complete len:102 (-) Transcript_21403:640-945(-)